MIPTRTVRFCDECSIWDACEGIALRLSKDDKGCEQRCTVFEVEAVLRSPIPDPFLDQEFRMGLMEFSRQHNPNRVCRPKEQ
jgi:hypothetical protein